MLCLCCRCKRHCLEKLGEDNVEDMFKKFYGIQSKNEQDIFLEGLIDVEDVKNRRPHVETPKSNSTTFKYHLTVGTQQKEVCMKACLDIYGVKVKHIR